VLLEDFRDMNDKRKFDMEFRILQRMTQHKGHVKNLFNSPNMEFRKQNRYPEVLPCKLFIPLLFPKVKHNRVVLKEVPSSAGSVLPGAEEMKYYMNASYINVRPGSLIVDIFARRRP